MHRTSIKDIARMAGVSPSTVSRALSGSPRVSADTKTRIQTIASELHYTPSVAARSLVTGKSRMLGVVTPGLTDPYIAAVMEGIEQAGRAASYRLVVAFSLGDADHELDAVRMLWGQQPDGLIILSSRATDSYVETLPELDCPVAFVNARQRGERFISIATDNEYGGWLATNHLVDLGHEKIAYLGGPSEGRSQQARAAGYRRALQTAGLPFDQALVLPGDGSIAAGRRACRTLLAAEPEKRASAIFCYNDLSALGLLAEAHQQGLHIPGALSVVGFDNTPYAQLSHPPLTTVDQRTTELGRLAVETIFAALRDEPVADVNLRGDLIHGTSTAGSAT